MGRNDPITKGQEQSGKSARTLQIIAAWDAYYGRFKKPLKPSRMVDDSVIVNRVRPIVDAAAYSLMGNELDIKLGPKEKKSAQKALDDIWRKNRKMTLLQKLAVNGAIAGQAYLKLLPEQPIPRLVALDPATVDVYTAPDDMDVVTDYVITYNSTSLASGKTVQRRQLISRVDTTGYGSATQQWTTQDQERETSADQWSGGAAIPWPYPFPPIIDAQNLPSPNTYYGLATVSPDLIQINNDINYILSLMARVIRFHGGPKMVGKGFEADQLKVAVDGTVILPDPSSVLEMLEMKGDLSGAMTVVEKLEGAMEVLARVPSIALAALKDMPRGTISGAALNLLYQPRKETVQVQQRLYGEMIKQACVYMLAMQGMTVSDVELNWPDFIPSDDAGLVTYVQGLLTIGVSKHTAFNLLGQDYDKEQALKTQEILDAKANQEAAGITPQALAPANTDPADLQARQSGQNAANGANGASASSSPTSGAAGSDSGPARQAAA